ncbi:MAG: phosphoribosylformylglycinamidine synthase subunit PurL [Candidatus Cloacimonadales bacterium]|jgi:phosphoribosylformylglycinamidine synthase|nr:phosphoribosylformylglycinamidine synthase subunit PurL [Candidatus Cloacimonadota bacterium]MDD2649559.1 phosphoribosylformylglycinamidine synthase subunit PurL [Candidatus Cloacimonadota bacterium]MDD3500893.1 phosphoribosylformylglycinamidine synthase subunit PurL [Candidatus Cloacimonadota bacterium]MDX9977672.1 phosphoribosylformylglycinamidine synthase subunit PurL [Candidatus Cloacimonadales bacterium]
MQEPKVDLNLALEHGLTEEEYELVLKTIGRVPTFTELGIVSVMWSEHASYKNSIEYLKKLPKDGPFMLTKAGEENAGVVDIGDNLAISFKIESHNHPSAVEPYHGAATGVGGILRDIFTMGARPICALNSLRFGNPDDPRVKFLIKGVVAGIADYGNCFGVPTVGGEVYFEDAYAGNPLVNAMAVGLMKHEDLMTASADGPGNFVVFVGAKTGRDGIHGTTFASADLSEETEENRTAVQVGDPFMEKLLLEASLEVIQKKLVVGIQDMGAAGLTCSTSEMSAKANNGIEIDVALVPQREKGMTAYEIMLSESQERMLMVVEPHNFDEVKAIFEKWDLHAEKIGVVTDDGLLRVKHNGELKAELPSQFLVLGGDAPVYKREFKKPDYIDEIQKLDVDSLHKPNDYNHVLLKLAATPNIASKKSIYQQYDHMVQINTMVEPGSDAAVIRIKDTNKAIAVATDCNARLCYLNPYEGAKGAVAESARNVVCSGAKPVAITNCLNFGNPYKPEVYWTFVEAIKGMSDACIKFETPVTGGNVSFYNESPAGAVYPTPTIGMLGLLQDNSKVITSHYKNLGDLIYLLGDHCNEVGGSQYLKEIHNLIKGNAPIVDLDKEALLYETVLKLADERLLQSAHDCSDGGLAIALMESCFAPGGKYTGCKIQMNFENREDIELFGESHSRIVVSVKPEDKEAFEAICQKEKQAFMPIGEVVADKITINNLIDLPTTKCAEAFYSFKV